MATLKSDAVAQRQNTKRCWNCHTHLPLHVNKCTYCGRKVLDVDKNGIAKKPFDWRGYAMSILSIVAFCVFIWWAFLKDKQ